MFNFKKQKNKLLISLLILGFLVRLLGGFLLGTQDVEWWKAWSNYSVKENILEIYGAPDNKVTPLLGHKTLEEINLATRNMIPYNSFKYGRKE